jgi:hypothetical protein
MYVCMYVCMYICTYSLPKLDEVIEALIAVGCAKKKTLNKFCLRARNSKVGSKD